MKRLHTVLVVINAALMNTPGAQAYLYRVPFQPQLDPRRLMYRGPAQPRRGAYQQKRGVYIGKLNYSPDAHNYIIDLPNPYTKTTDNTQELESIVCKLCSRYNDKSACDKCEEESRKRNSSSQEPFSNRHTAKRYFSAKKMNIGYLYNRGTKKYVVRESERPHYAVLRSKNDASPTKLAIFMCHLSGKGTSMHIQHTTQSDYDNKEYTNFYKFHGKRGYLGAQRNSFKLGSRLQFMSEGGGSYAEDRFAMTLPYYTNDRAVKISAFDNCLGADNEDNLVYQACVEDHDGKPTKENDRQLFVWCPVEDMHLCEQDYTRSHSY